MNWEFFLKERFQNANFAFSLNKNKNETHQTKISLNLRHTLYFHLPYLGKTQINARIDFGILQNVFCGDITFALCAFEQKL